MKKNATIQDFCYFIEDRKKVVHINVKRQNRLLVMDDAKNEVAAMQSEQQFCLRWNDHQSTLVAIFEALLDSSTLVDCTLAAEGQYLKAHKVVLSACSPYFQLLLSQHTDKHPIVILKDVKFEELKAMVDYMYRGEVNIPQAQLGPLLKAAESLQIRGLGGASNQDTSGISEKSLPFHKGIRERELPARSERISPPPRPLSSGAVGDTTRSNQNTASRRGSVSPTPRKRSRLLRAVDGTDTRSPSATCEQSPQNHHPLVPDASSAPSHISLSVSNRATAPARHTEWPDISVEKTSSLPTSSVDSSLPLAPLSSFSDVAGDSSGSRKWAEMGTKRVSSPAGPNLSSGAASVDSQKLVPISEILLVPKTEYVEVEDDSLTNAMLEDVQDLETSGPSHADGSSSSGAFVPWLENLEGVPDEATGQDMAAAYRASQGLLTARKGNTCCSVAGCTTSYKNSEKSVKFYRFPARKHYEPLRQLWIDCINRNVGFKKPWQPTKYSRICSKHFIGNRKSFDPRSPSYVPTLFARK